MTREEAITELMQIYMSLSEEKKQALDVLMAQADGEYIGRQAVMDCYKKWQPYMATRLHEFEKELSELPSVAIPSAYKGMTNGEVIKMVFPNIPRTLEWHIQNVTDDDWWNSPYEPQESEE